MIERKGDNWVICFLCTLHWGSGWGWIENNIFWVVHLRFCSWQGKITILSTEKSSGMVRLLLGLSVLFTRVLVGKLKLGFWLKAQELHEELSALLFVFSLVGKRKVLKFSTPICVSDLLFLLPKSSTLVLPLSDFSKSLALKTSTSKSSTLGLPRSKISKSSTLASLPPLASTLPRLLTFLLLS